jgi:hypothetical protein
MTTRRSPILGALIWTEECNQELRDLYANGRSNKELAELTGRTVHAIERRKHLLGLHGGSPTCRRCGVPLEQGGAHRPANYCSRECERWGFYEATVGHQPMVEIKGVCAHCRKPFARIVKPTGRGQKESGLAAYCSRDCDKAAWYQRMKAGPAGPAFMRSRNKRTGIYKKRVREARGPLQPARPLLYLPWTLEEDQLVTQMYSSGATHRAIAAALGRSAAAVDNRLAYLKIRGSRQAVRNVQRGSHGPAGA